MNNKLTPEQAAFAWLPAYIALQMPSYEFAALHQLIAGHLMAVECGQRKRLMVFIAPRSGKTMEVSEFFPAWYLGRNPSKQIIAATYSFDRAGDMGRKVRNQMIDPLHHSIFENCNISKDSKGANKFSTDQGGNYYSVGIGGAITGRGADLLLIDDPVKGREDAESEISRRKAIEWFSSVAYTRLMPGGAIILITTRWHFNDLAGYLLEENSHENWTVLSLPAIAEEDNDILGRKRGEALWPERYPLETLQEIKKTIGTREWNALYQQQPVATEGGMVQFDWFNRYDLKAPPEFKKIVISWDTAFKEKQLNDPSAGTVWGLADKNFYLLDVINKRMDFPKLKKKVIQIYEYYSKKYKKIVPVLIEDKASGQSLIQELKKNTKIPVIAIKAEASKEIRLSEVTALIEAGRVYLPEKAKWLVDYETQMIRFPNDKHDDMVDSTSQFLRWAGKPRFIRSGAKYYK